MASKSYVRFSAFLSRSDITFSHLNLRPGHDPFEANNAKGHANDFKHQSLKQNHCKRFICDRFCPPDWERPGASPLGPLRSNRGQITIKIKGEIQPATTPPINLYIECSWPSAERSGPRRRSPYPLPCIRFSQNRLSTAWLALVRVG